MYGAIFRETRLAARALIRRPVFAVSVILTLGLGISVTVVMWSVMDLMFLRQPRGVLDASRIVRVYFTQNYPGFGANTQQATSYQQFLGIQEKTRTLTEVAAVYALNLTLGRGDRSHPIRVCLASSNFFHLAGIHPTIGRFFSSEETQPGSAADLVVLSNGLWRRDFGSDTKILGQSVYLGGRRYTVIGIAPEGFSGIDLVPVDAWLPLPAARDVAMGPSWPDAGAAWLEIIGRLQAKVTTQKSAEELKSLFRATLDSAEQADPNSRASTGPLLVARGPKKIAETQIALWLSAMAAIVYLISCANVQNLMLQRALQRRRDLAIRVALGATRSRLALQLLAEAGLLAFGSGLLALSIAVSGGGLIEHYLIPSGYSYGNALDARVLIILTMLTIISALSSSLLPLRSTHSGARSILSAGERISSGRTRIRLVLVAGQVALSVLLLVSAGLFLRSLRQATKVDLGMETSRVLVVKFDLRATGMTSIARVEFYNRARERAAALPGIGTASLATVPPLAGVMIEPVVVPGRDSLPQAPGGGPFVNAVSPDFFRTVGAHLLQGRAFSSEDGAVIGGVIIINQTMARLLWPGGDALGKCVELASAPDSCASIVGIVADTHNFSLRELPSMQYYVPLRDRDTLSQRTLILRTSAKPSSDVGRVRRAIEELDPSLPFVDVSPLQTSVDDQMRPFRAGATLLSVFGAFALVLTGIGLFGVIAYSVSQQTRELGIRMALGASGAMILRRVMQQGLLATLVGTLVGALGAVSVSKALSALLYGVNGADLLTFTAVVPVVSAVAIAACYIPARSATRIDPVRALRVE